MGWCAPGRYYDEVIKLKLYTSLATPTLPQLAIAEFLAGGGYEHHLRQVRRLFETQVGRLSRLIGEHFPKGTKITRPAGGFVVWAELSETIDAMALHDRVLAEGISIAPGAIFSPKQKFKNFIRLNAGLEWNDAVERAVFTVGKIAREMAGQSVGDA